MDLINRGHSSTPFRSAPRLNNGMIKCYAIAMSSLTFKHILLIGRPHVPGVPETLQQLVDYLTQLGVEIAIEDGTAACLDHHTLSTCTVDTVPNSVDLVIVVGGDGSLLNAAHCAMQYDIPIIGVHRGRLGFLTDIHPQHIDQLNDILHGHFQSETRMLLNAHSDGIQEIALNDVVLMPADAPHMIEFEIFINKDLVGKQRADGLIIATPTGSTAYALSAGGPIMKPGSETLVILPICPHTLSSRPLVVNADSVIDIYLTKHNPHQVNMSCDGTQHYPLDADSHIHITRHTRQLTLIHPSNYNYFATLREKLGWERHAERT